MCSTTIRTRGGAATSTSRTRNTAWTFSGRSWMRASPRSYGRSSLSRRTATGNNGYTGRGSTQCTSGGRTAAYGYGHAATRWSCVPTTTSTACRNSRTGTTGGSTAPKARYGGYRYSYGTTRWSGTRGSTGSSANRGSSKSTARSRTGSGRAIRLCRGYRVYRVSSSRSGSQKGGNGTRAYATTTTWTRKRCGPFSAPAGGSSNGRSATGSSTTGTTVATTGRWAWPTNRRSHGGCQNRNRGHASSRRRTSSRSTRRTRHSGTGSARRPGGHGRASLINRGPAT